MREYMLHSGNHIAPGIQAPRSARDGSALPSARLVSITVHEDLDNPASLFTHMGMLLGQFVDHDATRTAVSILAAAPSGIFSGCQTSQEVLICY